MNRIHYRIVTTVNSRSYTSAIVKGPRCYVYFLPLCAIFAAFFAMIFIDAAAFFDAFDVFFSAFFDYSSPSVSLLPPSLLIRRCLADFLIRRLRLSS